MYLDKQLYEEGRQEVTTTLAFLLRMPMPLLLLFYLQHRACLLYTSFTLTGDLLPPQYPATYAHELAHFLGISSEAEANFYAYQVGTRSHVKEIRFSGYLSVLSHVLGNASRLMSEDEYAELFDQIRPVIIELAQKNQQYWMEKYSPLIGDIQNFIYDLYLKGNTAPALSVGVPMSVAISTQVSFRSTLVA